VTTGRRVAVAGALAVLAAAAARAREVPFLSGRVNDTAGIVPIEVRQRLEGTLADFEKRTGAQIAVLTIDSLDGDVLEDYSMRVVETWKLGRKGVNDGVLLLVAKNDRKMRLEVGYGLEGKLPDAICTRILDNIVRPRFRDGDFGGGIEAGVTAAIATLDGKQDAVPAEAPTPTQSTADMPLPVRLVGMLLFAVVVGVFSLLALFGKGCMSWFLYVFLMPFHFAFPSAFIHPSVGVGLFLIWLVGFPIFKVLLAKTPWGVSFGKRHAELISFASSSGHGGSGSSWSSGSSSSGGFSGGGGSFGGGGSSSSW
jgi:uncharacterized protein